MNSLSLKNIELIVPIPAIKSFLHFLLQFFALT